MVKIELATILFSNKNIELAYRLHKSCLKMCMNLVTCINFVELTIKTLQLKPQIIFVDMTTIDINSSQLKVFMENGEYKNIKFVFIGNQQDKKQIDSLDLNCDFVHIEQVENYVIDCVNILELNAFTTQKEEQHNQELSSMIANMLFSLGFSPKHTGYYYLKEIIKQVSINGGVISSLISDQYPIIAVKYKTTSCNIERNIRNAIGVAYKVSSKQKWNDFFSVSTHVCHDKRPTNREFICMCVDVILSNYPMQMVA